MPTFDFRCKDCGHISEVRVSLADQHKVVCEKCQSPRVEKQVSTFAAAVKGGGAAATAQACPHAHTCGAGCPHSH